MLLVYVFLFLLHLTASACDATSRNQHLFLATAAEVPAPSPSTAIHNYHHATTAIARAQMQHASSSFHGYIDATAMMQQQGSPPPRPDVKLRGDDLEGTESATPLPRVDGVYEEAGGDAIGGAGGPSQVTGGQPDRNVDIGNDYAPPRTHPPSHN